VVGTSVSLLGLGRRPTVAGTNDAVPVEGVLAASVGMQGSTDALPTVVQDALYVPSSDEI